MKVSRPKKSWKGGSIRHLRMTRSDVNVAREFAERKTREEVSAKKKRVKVHPDLLEAFGERLSKIATVEVNLPVAGSIRAQERKWISSTPQMPFKAKRLMVRVDDKGKFLVHDIRVGRDSQFAAPGPIPLEVFVGEGAKGPNFHFPTCQVGQVFELLIENVSGHDLGFGIMVVGDTLI